jgi:hypothetical protein
MDGFKPGKLAVARKFSTKIYICNFFTGIKFKRKNILIFSASK